MTRRGHPRADRLALVEAIVVVLREHPELSANDVQRRVCARRADVLRVVRALRDGQVVPEPPPDRPSRFPYSERAGCA
jgi:hypothetical protein